MLFGIEPLTPMLPLSLRSLSIAERKSTTTHQSAPCINKAWTKLLSPTYVSAESIDIVVVGRVPVNELLFKANALHTMHQTVDCNPYAIARARAHVAVYGLYCRPRGDESRQCAAEIGGAKSEKAASPETTPMM